MMNKQKIDFVTVTYGNMFSDVKRTVESLYKFTPPPFNLYIINNGSTDETLTYFDKFPNCKVINRKGNTGMVEGFNVGVKLSDSPYIVRMDHDIELIMPWREKFLSWFEKDKRIGMVGPRVLTADGRIYSACFHFYFRHFRAIKISNILGVPKRLRHFFYWSENHFAQDDEKYSVAKEVPHITGTFEIIKREAFEKVGLFDSSYPEKNGVLEDLDYTLRMSEMGYKIIYDGTVKIIHYCSRPSPKASPKPNTLKKSNRRRLRKKWGI